MLISSSCGLFLEQADMWGTYFAEHGTYDARSLALQQTLLIDRMMTNEVFHHQQEGSNAVSLKSAF